MPADPMTARKEYQSEVEEVAGLLDQAADELQDPLRQLVRMQIERAAPHVRAAVVLAFGVPAEDSPAARQKRIYLAAALEMLFVAHQIHKLLLTSDADIMDKSILGSTILTGDFCYSRSAALAVQTDNSEVVRIFSEALKRVSEGNLRALFSVETDAFDETESLFASGIQAGRVLAGVGRPTEEFSERWAKRLTTGLAASSDPIGLTSSLALTDSECDRIPMIGPSANGG